MADFGKTVGKISVRVAPDVTGLRKELQAKLDKIEEQLQDLTVNLDADTTLASIRMDDFYQEWDNRDLQFRAAVDDAAAKLELARVSRNRTVNLFVKTNDAAFAKSTAALGKLSGANIAQKFFHDITESILELDQNTGKISRVSTAIANLTSVMLSSVSSIVTISSDILSIAQLAITGPAVFGALATGVTTLIVALKSAGTELASLGPAFTSLKESIQSNFWAQAKAPIESLITTLLPSLQKGLGSVAKSLGSQFGTLATSIQKALGGGVLDYFFKQISTSIDIVTQAMQPLTDAFVTLGKVGASYLPRLSTAFVGVIKQFDSFIQKNAANGNLFAWVEEGVTALKNVFSAATGIVGIFVAINTAATAAGNGGLATFASSLQAASALMNSPAIQTAMTTVLEGVGAAMSGLGDGVKSIGSALVDLAPTISTVLAVSGQALGSLLSTIGDALKQPAVAEGLTNLFVGISQGIEGLKPAVAPVLQLLGDLGTTVGVLASQFGPLFGTIKTTFAPALESVLAVVNKIVPILAGDLTNAIHTLTPLIQGISGLVEGNSTAFAHVAIGVGVAVAAITGVVKLYQTYTKVMGALTIARGIATKAANLDLVVTARLKAMYAADWLKGFIAQLGSQVKAFALATAAKVKDLAQTALLKAMYARDMVAAIGQVIAAKAREAAAWVASTAKMVASAIATKAVAVAQKALAVGQKAAAAAQWLLNAAMSANPIGIIVVAIAALVAGLIWFFTQTKLGQAIWAGFVSFLTAAWKNIVAVATTVFTALGQFFTSFWQGLVTVATTVWTAITTAVSTAFSAVVGFFTAFGATVSALWNGYWAAWVLVVTTVGTAISTAVSTAFSAVVGFFTSFGATVASIWSAFWTGLQVVGSAILAGIVAVVNLYITGVRTVITTVVNAIKSAWTASWNAISAVVTTVFGAVSGFVSGVVNTIKSYIAAGTAVFKATWSAAWSAISSTVSNVAGAISSAAAGIVSSVKSKIQGVKDTFSGIKDTIAGALSGAGSWFVNSGKAIVQGIIDGITSKISAAGDAISSVMGKISSFLPHSPAEDGPFSGRGWTLYSGQAISQALADGMQDRVAAVKASAAALVAAANPDVGSIDYSEAGTGLEAAGRAKARQLQLLAMGTNVTVEGNVGWDPDELAQELNTKKRQAQMSVDLGSLVTP